MSSDLRTSMVILTLPGCFDIRVREWPLRKLKFRCKTLQDGGGEENASRNIHVQTWRLRARGGVLLKSIASS